MTDVIGALPDARRAARSLAIAPRAEKDAVLRAAARAIEASAARIASENALDVKDARDRGVSDALVDRLVLDASRIASIARVLREIAAEDDPVGEVLEDRTRPNGLRVRRVRVPIGVIGMIYEARPSVTAEAFALAFKAGNAIVLRGGSDASRTNAAIGDAIRGVLPEKWRGVLVLADPTRESVLEMVRAEGAIDLVIPRGGEALVRFVTENARVPVVQHYKGVCHAFVDASADLEDAKRVVVNAKMSRPGVCNALECLLVHESVAERFLPALARALGPACEIRGCERTVAIVPTAKRAAPDDFGREFLDRVLAVRVVADLDAALDHVARFGSGHTEAILTRDESHAARFRSEVDAACVVVNASTRFHDGGELGLGTEIGIATSRLHWRGPMGLESLTTMKWLVDGSGQTR